MPIIEEAHEVCEGHYKKTCISRRAFHDSLYKTTTKYSIRSSSSAGLKHFTTIIKLPLKARHCNSWQLSKQSQNEEKLYFVVDL